MNINEYSANSLSFIGDAVYTLRVREFFISSKYQASDSLQYRCNLYNSAKGQMKVYNRLLAGNFLSIEEEEVFKRGRNAIRHIPKNGDLLSYSIASGLEALVGYLYLTDKKRLDDLFNEIFKGGFDNE